MEELEGCQYSKCCNNDRFKNLLKMNNDLIESLMDCISELHKERDELVSWLKYELNRYDKNGFVTEGRIGYEVCCSEILEKLNGGG